MKHFLATLALLGALSAAMPASAIIMDEHGCGCIRPCRPIPFPMLGA